MSVKRAFEIKKRAVEMSVKKAFEMPDVPCQKSCDMAHQSKEPYISS